MHRHVVLASCFILFLVGPLAAQDATEAARRQEDAARRAEIVRKLQSLRVNLDFDETPLEDVIDFIRQMSGINFIVDRKVYVDIAPDDLRVTLTLTDLSLRSALKLMLDMLDLKAIYRDGVVLIVPKNDKSFDTRALRIYDVRDLLMQIRDFPGPEISLTNGDDDGSTGSSFTAGSDEPNAPDPEFIVETIKKNTGGNSWEEDEAVSIELNNGLLVVVQTPEVHREIIKLINLLRRFK